MPNTDIETLFADFLAFKRSQGYSYDSHLSVLRRFASFLEEHAAAESPLITEAIMLEWIADKGKLKQSTRSLYATVTRQFALYLRRCGYDCYVLPESLVPKKSRDFVPYIFTHEEITKVTEAFDAMPPNSRAKSCHIVYPALFRTVYGCMLRRGEAGRLLIEDVDLKNGTLFVNHSKNDASRMLPMSESLIDYLVYYFEIMDLAARSPRDPFFPSWRGKEIAGTSVLATFQRRFREAGVVNQEGNAPRAHDLRHTAACHALENAEQNGISMYAFLPTLSAYLGHSDIHDTEKYLHLRGELQEASLSKMDEYYSNIYPEVNNDQ